VWLAVVRRGVDGVPCAARVTPSLALAGVWPTQEGARADADALLLLPVLHGASVVLVEPGGLEPEGVKHGGLEPNGQSSCPCERYPFGLVVRAKAAYPAPKTACEPVGASACATPLPPMVG
jgi:hypothetical protein